MPRRKTYAEVKKVFEDAGYTLLSTEYKNGHKKLDYICPKGHRGSSSYSNFNAGKRCAICAGVARNTYDHVKKAFEKEGYTLLSTEYKNAYTKLDFICPKGHKSSITYTGFQQGKRCRYCASEAWAKTKTLSFDKVKKVFEDAGYTLLSTEYVSAHEKLLCRCPNGHEYSVQYANFQQGKRCPVCNRIEQSKRQALTLEFVRQKFKEAGYTLLSDTYVNSAIKLRYLCDNGHEGSMTYANFSNGKRCPRCAHNISRAEVEIRDYVISLVGEDKVKANIRSIIPPYELDIFVPSRNLAVEYCGLYWHGEVGGGKPHNYHRVKMDMCIERDIRLITIFEDEFLERPEIIKSRIANALGVINKRIYARKCEVRQISNVNANDFLYDYHLQGSSKAAVSFGLFYNDELLQVLTLGNISRAHAAKVNGKKVRMLELKRFASKPFISVVGGAGKLFKHALLYARENGFGYIKSYSDNRYGNPFSSVYEKLGFYLVGESKYTPHYVMDEFRYRNQSLRKTKEERLTGKTEWELRREQGYDRIWDCGHKTYLYDVV